MEVQQIHTVALARGCMLASLDEVTRQTQAHFAGTQPKPADIEAYIDSLPVWDKIAMDRGEFLSMPPDWRLSQARSFQPRPQSRRPVMRNLSAQELDSIKDLPFHERMTQGRELQQSPAPPPQGG
jgi:hypothetical protein